jgi:hypothetical protein
MPSVPKRVPTGKLSHCIVNIPPAMRGFFIIGEYGVLPISFSFRHKGLGHGDHDEPGAADLFEPSGALLEDRIEFRIGRHDGWHSIAQLRKTLTRRLPHPGAPVITPGVVTSARSR